MKQIIDHIKELQKEYHAGTPAHTVLRKLEVELPGLFPEFDKFTLLKDTPTIATDNTLPPPTGETAPKFSMTFFMEKYQVLDTNHEGFIRTDLALIAMQEYAAQERKEARRQAIQECIDLVEGISIQGWVTDSKPFEKIIKQLEKLKK